MEQAKEKFNAPHQLGLFGFLMITVSMVVSIYIYPTFATSGFSMIFFLLFAGILFFMPVCLTAAEMGTGGSGWSNAGVFSWGTAALGERWGFMMIYLQFMQISIGFVAMLYFISGAISFLFDNPAINSPGWIQFLIIFLIFWIITLASRGGTKITKYFASYGFIFGVIIPLIFLIIMGIVYLSGGNHVEIQFTENKFFPNFEQLGTIVALASFILSFMGTEASAVHVNHLAKPTRNYPLAILILAILTITIGSLSGLTIAITIPQSQISLNAGLLEAFKYLLDFYGVGWIRYPIAILISLSAIGEIASWVNGPVRGMLFAAQNGILHPKMSKMNKHNMPINLMWVQGILVSFWTVLLTFGSVGGGNIAFFTAVALTVITYLTMYVLLFISYLVLKTKYPDNPRKFKLPAWLGWIVYLLGMACAIFAFFTTFAKPAQLQASDYGNYLIILVCAYIVIFAIPHILYSIAKKREARWKEVVNEMFEKGHTIKAKCVVDEEHAQSGSS